jgi:hypothetical protein
MKVSIKRSLGPLLESKNGIHMTSYLPKAQNLIAFKSQLREVYFITDEFLKPVLPKIQRKLFLQPLSNMINDTNALKKFNENVGIFLTKDYLRFINIPVPVEQTCIVADSFHVKPLLKWIQQDQEFLILCFGKNFASLYQGTQATYFHVDRLLFNENIHKKDVWQNTMQTIAYWINDVTYKNKPILFFAGDKEMINAVRKYTSYPLIFNDPIMAKYQEQNALDVCFKVRSILRLQSRELLASTIWEISNSKLVNFNIHEIAKAAIRGDVKKLIISEEMRIFGKINKSTGEVRIHADDIDHEDDDLLDDIAQAVLALGGEVTIAKNSQLPRSKPIMALIYPEIPNELYLRNEVAQ